MLMGIAKKIRGIRRCLRVGGLYELHVLSCDRDGEIVKLLGRITCIDPRHFSLDIYAGTEDIFMPLFYEDIGYERIKFFKRVRLKDLPLYISFHYRSDSFKELFDGGI